MVIHVKSFWLPKSGNTEKEYEDSFYPVRASETTGHAFRCAVADGSSEGMLSGIWAQVLVRRWGRSPDSLTDINDALLTSIYADWARWTKHYRRLRHQQSRPLQWYEEHGLDRGAFSTLLGLSLLQEGSRWSCVGVGDSCLFQVRGQQVVFFFPLARSADFGNRPVLVSSNDEANCGLSGHVKKAEGNWQVDDVFYLMTDALAAWCLAELEQSRDAHWQKLRDLDTQEEGSSFSDWIVGLRQSNQIRNDDVTLMRIDMLVEA